MLVIEANIPEVILELDAFRRQQLPFATSLAVNTVAKTARAEQVAGIFERFTVRRPARLRTSVTFQASNKRSLEATLTVRDAFLVQHEQGGKRRPGDVTSSIVQPVRARERRVGIIRGRTTPRAILRQKRAFTAQTKRGKVGVYVRPIKTAAPELVFALEPEVTLQPRLQFAQTVERVVARDWERDFGRSLARAISSARR